MAKLTFKVDETLVTQFRAVCRDDSYKGKWRDTDDEAYADANDHQNKPGNEEHIIDILRKQTSKMRFNKDK